MTTAPMIHMNGTSAGKFLEELEQAAHHLRIVKERLVNIAPHMRDYYVLEDGAEKHKQARAEHLARLTMLDVVGDDIEALRYAILDQVKP